MPFPKIPWSKWSSEDVNEEESDLFSHHSQTSVTPDTSYHSVVEHEESFRLGYRNYVSIIL